LTAEIVRWLKVKGHLNDHNLPIQVGRSNKVLLINTEPRNPTGKQFNTYRQIDSWFVNTNYNATQHVRNVRGVIQLAQLDPADFAVRLQE